MSRLLRKSPGILFATLQNPLAPIALAAAMSLTVIGASLYLSLFAGRSLLPGPLITQLEQQLPAPVAVQQATPGAEENGGGTESGAAAASVQGSGAAVPSQAGTATRSATQRADEAATAGMRLPEHGSIQVFAVNKAAKGAAGSGQDGQAGGKQLYSSNQGGPDQSGNSQDGAVNQPSGVSGKAAERHEGKADSHHGNRQGDHKTDPGCGGPGRQGAGQAANGNHFGPNRETAKRKDG